jgi:hypothetical protein
MVRVVKEGSQLGTAMRPSPFNVRSIITLLLNAGRTGEANDLSVKVRYSSLVQLFVSAA